MLGVLKMIYNFTCIQSFWTFFSWIRTKGPGSETLLEIKEYCYGRNKFFVSKRKGGQLMWWWWWTHLDDVGIEGGTDDGRHHLVVIVVRVQTGTCNTVSQLYL